MFSHLILFKPRIQNFTILLLAIVSCACCGASPSAKEPESVIQMRQALKHGLADKSREALLQCQLQIEQGTLSNWSEGRLCYYDSLVKLLEGEFEASIHAAGDSFRKGILEFGEAEELFQDEVNDWYHLVSYQSSEKKVHLSGSLAKPHVYFVKKTSGDPVGVVKGIVKKIRGIEKDQSENPPDILNDVRLATWELLLGEYAASHPQISLPTTSIDSLISGQRRLAAIELQIEEDPTLEDRISSEPELAMRLDTVRVRKIAFDRREHAARIEEVRRLGQLRELVRTYRDLTASMLRWQMFSEIGDVKRSRNESVSSLENLQSIYDVVNSRRELHLFDDEPVVNNDSEFSVVETEPQPFSDNTLATFKALQGLAYFDNVETDPEFDDRVLEQAEVWASAALINADGPLSLPDGADPDNVVAKWVLSLASEFKASRIAINKDKEKRLQAKSLFSKSKQLLAELIEICEKRGVEIDSKMILDAKDRYAALDSPEEAIGRARELVSLGQPNEARNTLLSALCRHPVQSIGVERLRVGLRAGIAPPLLRAEWDELLAAEIFDQESFDAQIVLGEIRNRSAAIFLTSDLADHELKSEELQNLENTLSTLNSFCDEPKLSGSERAVAKSVFSLAFAQKELLSSVVEDELSVAIAYRHAKDAEFRLVKDINSINEQETDSEGAILLRDSLIAARLAAGHLAAIHLEDWQVDSQISFLAATDAAAKLQPTAPLLSLLGRPLLNRVFNNTADKSTKLAAVEKQRRQMITRCLEAIFTAEFGSVQAGAEAMQTATELSMQTFSEDEPSVNLDPDQFSALADGFDSKVTLPQTIQAFGVLSEVRAGLYSESLSHAVRLAVNDQEKK